MSKQKEFDLVDSIESCAKSLNIHPSQVQWNDYQKWLSRNSKENETPFPIDLSKQVKLAGGFSNIRDSAFSPLVSTDAVEIKARAKNNRAMATSKAEDLYFTEVFTKMFKDVFSKNPIKIDKMSVNTKPAKMKRTLISVMSDLHIGSDISGEEFLTPYGRIEEARSLAQVAFQIGDYKTIHREETDLVVLLLGDIIEGKIHEAEATTDRAEQICRAMHLLSQFFAYLLTKFNKVTVKCIGGNHDRDALKNPQRATVDRIDNDATVIYFALKTRFANVPNISFDIPTGSYLDFDILGNHVMATHGDTLLNIGYPGSAINTKKALDLTNAINATRSEEEKFKLFIIGHVHCGTVFHMDNGATFLTNGTLQPANGYTEQFGKIKSVRGQYIIESTPDFCFGDSRFIVVDDEVNKNASLDKIIRPFEGY